MFISSNTTIRNRTENPSDESQQATASYESAEYAQAGPPGHPMASYGSVGYAQAGPPGHPMASYGSVGYAQAGPPGHPMASYGSVGYAQVEPPGHPMASYGSLGYPQATATSAGYQPQVSPSASAGRSEVAMSPQGFRVSQAFSGMQLDNTPTQRTGGRPNSAILDKVARAKAATQIGRLRGGLISLATRDTALPRSAYALSVYNHPSKTLNVTHIYRQEIPYSFEDTIPRASDFILAQLASAENLTIGQEADFPSRLPNRITQERVVNPSTRDTVNEILGNDGRQRNIKIQRNHEPSGPLDNLNLHKVLQTPNGGVVRHLVSDYNSIRNTDYLVNSVTVMFKHDGSRDFDLNFDIMDKEQARRLGPDELHRSNPGCCAIF